MSSILRCANQEEAIGEAGSHGLPTNEDNPDSMLMAHEFVQALLRLGRARYGDLIAKGSDPSPLSSALERMMDHCICPATGIELNDKLSMLCRDRRVRARADASYTVHASRSACIPASLPLLSSH